MSLIACLSGPEHTRANAEVALEDNHIPHLPEKHHGMMDWNSKLPPHASDEAEKQAKKRKHDGPQGFITIHVADASELNAAVAAVEKHGWTLRVHYPEPDAPKKSTSMLEELERRIIALEAQSARPPMMGGAMESPGFANQASSYAAEVARRAIFSPYARTVANTPGILAGGLLSATDMQLSAPGSGLSTNISVGEAIVGGSEGGVQGGYYTRNASTTNLAIATANASNPRIDTVCVTIADAGYTEPTGVAGNAAVLQVVTGTATAGATLVNLSGKAALPLSSLLLGYVLVPATATNIITADIANKATVVSLLAAQNLLQLPSPQNRHVSFGLINGASATISAGSGDFTVVRNSTGNYTVNNAAWPTAYALIVTPTTSGGAASVANATTISGGTFTVSTFLSNTGAVVDTFFSFTVIY